MRYPPFCHTAYQFKAVRSLRRIAAGLVAPGDLNRAKRKLLSDIARSDDEKVLLANVSVEVHRNDEMYVPFDGGHYLSVGLSAVRCIEWALHQARQRNPVRSILDLPCGYGRVLRFLKVRFPNAEISAAEINSAAVEFCKRTFAVKSSISSTNFRTLPVPGQFDVIWCGSLVTHLDETATTELLRFFRNCVAPGGLCVLTTHGKYSVELVERNPSNYRLTPAAQRKILSQFQETGFGYADYKNTPGYGVSVVSQDRMRAIAGNAGRWGRVSFAERGWDNHQDVYGLSRD